MLFALLYLLLSAGGEVLQHAWAQPVAGLLVAHLHAPGDREDDCPPPAHDESHCPACKLTGLKLLSGGSTPGELSATVLPARVAARGGDLPPTIRSHAPPSLRAPPLRLTAPARS
ncbi:hypothetical protein [Longimicrobium sp.]|uniref:hypothetical protein n=1 Tax=Longimicrobium sp. TaxID=2029185 RepID=UPI002E36368C|nr:hypothetical protein [Longimicrobium sp.]HEX6041856.1 hypothetical protein [Longimicrobium sp.]